MSDSPIIVDTGNKPADSCVIWLHGLGADGHDFEPIIPELHLPSELNIRFLFPHAPMMPVTINQGFVMRAWYDIKSADISSEADETGIRQSAVIVDQLIEEQIADGIRAERIVLAGFSQGGAIVLQAGLRQKRHLAGIMALSTYLPLVETVAAEKSIENQNMPIFLAHGSIDPVIPVELAHSSRAQLELAGYSPEWREYPAMPHSVSLEEINDIADWLGRTLG